MNSYTLTEKLRKARRNYSLSSGAQALFYELMAINNEERWASEFKCPAGELCSALRISEKTLNSYRDELLNAELITYLSGKTKRCPSWYSLNGSSFGSHLGSKFYHQSEHPTEHPMVEKTPDLLKDKVKDKQLEEVEAITSEAGFNFFKQTANCRLLREKFNLVTDDLELHFKNFFDSKVDLGEFKNKKVEDIARNFYYWLPIHIQILEKEKSSGQKEKGSEAQRGVAAVLTAFSNVKRRPMK